MKKITSLLMAILMLATCVLPVCAASAVKADESQLPVIYIVGKQNTPVYKLDENGNFALDENGKIISEEILDSNGSGHGALATLLSGNKVDVLICGGIGGGAQMALAEMGIELYGGVSGNADEAVKAFLEESLAYNPNVKCDHHGEGHEHHGNCGSGGCGSHSCSH